MTSGDLRQRITQRRQCDLKCIYVARPLTIEFRNKLIHKHLEAGQCRWLGYTKSIECFGGFSVCFVAWRLGICRCGSTMAGDCQNDRVINNQ